VHRGAKLDSGRKEEANERKGKPRNKEKKTEQAVEEIESRHEGNRDPIAKLSRRHGEIPAHRSLG
jgi:hypothetical protein